MPLAGQELDHVWDEKDTEPSRDWIWLLLLGAHQVALLHVVLFQVLLSYIDSISLGEPRKRYDMFRSSHSILERWNSFKLGDGKLKSIKDK